MKKLFVLLMLASFTLVVIPVAFGQAATGSIVPRLGILPFTGGDGRDGETIATLFSFQSDILNAFTVVPRTSTVNALVAEQQFQMTGHTDSDTIARIGRLLNADFVVSGHIRRLGSRNLVITTIINVETFEQLAGDYREYRNIEEVQAMLPDIARVIIGASRRDSTGLPTLAVAPFHIASEGVNVQDAEVLAQILSVEIVNIGIYAVLPRTATMQSAMEELQFQLTGATAEEEAKALGRAVNADFVLSAEVRSLGSQNMFTASILHVEDGSLIAGGFRNYRSITDGIQLMAELAHVLTGSPPSGQTPQERVPRARRELSAEAYRLNTIGISAGSSLATPLFIGTIHGTFSPFRSVFLEAGVDLGLIYSGASDSPGYAVDGYYSLFPFAHAGFFTPFTNSSGWYIGAGGGYLISEYTFSDGTASTAMVTFNLTTGIHIARFLNISYTLRTNFERASNKVAVGVVYRFK